MTLHLLFAPADWTPIELFAALVFCHALADYPLQGDFLARGKNRFAPLPGVPWYWCLGAHAVIQAGLVWAVTGMWWLGLLEFGMHVLIDDAKCAGRFGPRAFDVDQLFHLLCKAVWVMALEATWR